MGQKYVNEDIPCRGFDQVKGAKKRSPLAAWPQMLLHPSIVLLGKPDDHARSKRGSPS